ncbi:MAG: hypothetical protein IT303_20170 [Dehalococcoidia bacterium]|nr:hypothetical protein [Dehalococcoidia bacterium]
MTKIGKFALSGVMALTLSLGLAACSDSGDDDNASADADETRTATQSDSTKPANNTATSTATATATTGADNSDDGLSLLRDATANLEEATYKLVYELTGEDDGTGALDGTLTIAADPPRQLMGISGSLGGEEGSFMILNDGTDSFLCVDFDGEQSCIKGTGSVTSAIPLPSIVSIEDSLDEIAGAPDVEVKEVAGQEIAGRDGRCFEVTSSEGTGLVCIDEGDGIVLLVDGEFGGSSGTLRLREYTDNPAASDFEPPYPVTEIP